MSPRLTLTIFNNTVLYRGEVRNECIDMLGKPSCRVADGSWQQCAASDDEAAPAVPAGDASPSVPTTLSGEACILPAVSEMTTTVECVACGAVRLTHISLSLCPIARCTAAKW